MPISCVRLSTACLALSWRMIAIMYLLSIPPPLNLAHQSAVFGRYVLDFLNGQLGRFVLTFQPLDRLSADLLHQIDAVLDDVAGLLGITGRALLVDVQWVEPKLWRGSYRTVMAGVILALMVPTTTDARQISVTQTDEIVHGLLRILQMIAAALDPLLRLADLRALCLVDPGALLGLLGLG